MTVKIVRIVGALGVLWNLVGVASYLAHVGMFGPKAAAPPLGGALMPTVITAAFAIAVFGGVAGSIGLALVKPWARPVLWISFVAAVVDWGWVFGFSGAASVPLGAAVLAIALALALVAQRMPANT